MALRADYVTRSGLPAPDAYVRVTDLNIAKTDGEWRLAFNAAVFANPAMAAQAHLTVDAPRGFQCPYDPEGPGPLEQAYDWLKTAEATPEVPAEPAVEFQPAVGVEGAPNYVPAVEARAAIPAVPAVLHFPNAVQA